MNLQELNHWWTSGKIKKELVPASKLELYNAIKKDFSRKQIQVIVGLRRTGKSTIMFQLIEKLLDEKVNPLNIFYCSFDETELQEKKVEQILEDYSKLTAVDYKKEKIYFFVDEIQKSKNWVDNLKLIYDNFKNIKIAISGSASLNILTEAKKNLAGRSIYYELKPLSFKEFLEIKEINIEKKHADLRKETLVKEFENFILRPFPELVHEKEISFIKNYIRNSIIEPVILKDIPKEFEDVDIMLLEKLAELFLKNPGQYLEVDTIARDLKRAKKTIYNAIFYLEFSYIIKRIYNFRPSTRSSSRKLSRVYAYHPCIAIPYEIPMDKYAENLVGFELDTKFYWRDKEKEIDFLKDYKPVEVKYASKIEKQDYKHIEYFMEKYAKKLNVSEAFIISKDSEEKSRMIKIMPLWKFCFSGLA